MALGRTQALSVAATLIYLSDPEARSDGDGGVFDPALDLDAVAALKTEWLRLMRTRAAAGNLLVGEPDLTNLLYRWKEYTASLEEPRHWVAEAIRTDEGFASMATRLMSRGTSHAAGDRVSTSRSWFNRQTIDDFMGVDVAMTRCNAIDPAAFPEHKQALQAMKAATSEWIVQVEAGS